MSSDAFREKLIVVIDDERTHQDGHVHLRSSAAALSWLDQSGGCREL